jgi:membrane protease YdiL (CAAX protease family)
MTQLFSGPDIVLICALSFIALILLAIPILDHRNKKRKHQPGARTAMFRETMVLLWLMALVATLGWVVSGRSLVDIGIAPVRDGWRGYVALGLMVLALGYCAYQLLQVLASKAARQSVRQQLEAVDLDSVRSETRSEALDFQALSVTAGITEEVVFRGVLIAAFALIMPVWVAVIASLIAFTLPHAYQGLGGLLRVLPTGAFLTAIVLVGGSLWPAIIAHIVIDMTAGLTFAILDRYETSDGSAAPDTSAAVEV